MTEIFGQPVGIMHDHLGHVIDNKETHSEADQRHKCSGLFWIRV
jgi:hypothetical protein